MLSISSISFQHLVVGALHADADIPDVRQTLATSFRAWTGFMITILCCVAQLFQNALASSEARMEDT